jgi:uncharacterized protein YqeY
MIITKKHKIMLIDEVKKQVSVALKSQDELRLSTLKMLLAALINAEIAKRPEKLTKEDELKVIQSEAKKRKDAIELYKQGGANDKADKEQKELEILAEYLPEEMSDEELTKIVEDVIRDVSANSMADMGKVMSTVMEKVRGKADGGRVSEIVKMKLG